MGIAMESGKERPAWVKSTTPGVRQTGLHVFASASGQTSFAGQVAAWDSLSGESRREWKALAARRRAMLAPVPSPLDNFLRQSHSSASCHTGHMWGLADLSMPFPLSRKHVCDVSNSGVEFVATATKWDADPTVAELTTADPDFPETVDAHRICDYECCTGIMESALPELYDSFKRLMRQIHQTVSYKMDSSVSDQVFLLQVDCGPLSLSYFVGDISQSGTTEHYEVGIEGHSDCHQLVLLPVDSTADDEIRRVRGELPLETNLSLALRVARMADDIGIAWVLSVLTGQVGVEPGTFRINGRQVITQAALDEAEVSKLQQAVALRAFKSLGRDCKIARRRRGGRGRGRGRGGALGAGAVRAEGSGDGVSESESCDESSDVNESDASAHDSPGEGALSERDETREAPKKAARIAKGREKRGEAWGPWMIADVISCGEVVGVGATCGGHLNASEVGIKNLQCKKQVTFGCSGLDRSVLVTRLKRWLLAGLADEMWDTEEKRSKHVGMGGQHLKDFADGMSDEAMEAVVSGMR